MRASHESLSLAFFLESVVIHCAEKLSQGGGQSLVPGRNHLSSGTLVPQPGNLTLKEALFCINIVKEVLRRETHIELKEMKRKTYSKPFDVATNQFGQQ